MKTTIPKRKWIRVVYYESLETLIRKEAKFMGLPKTTFIRTVLYNGVHNKVHPDILYIEKEVEKLTNNNNSKRIWRNINFYVSADFKKEATKLAEEYGIKSREKFLGYVLADFLFKRNNNK